MAGAFDLFRILWDCGEGVALALFSACPHLPQRGLADFSEPWDGAAAGALRLASGQVEGQLLLLRYLLLNLGTDIGHVDFLEKVHGLVERPYVIAGLHFDQVSAPGS